jgi:hypothetical protein
LEGILERCCAGDRGCFFVGLFRERLRGTEASSTEQVIFLCCSIVLLPLRSGSGEDCTTATTSSCVAPAEGEEVSEALAVAVVVVVVVVVETDILTEDAGEAEGAEGKVADAEAVAVAEDLDFFSAAGACFFPPAPSLSDPPINHNVPRDMLRPVLAVVPAMGAV